jgi:lambda repressor-like predicted transcriptional regulator
MTNDNCIGDWDKVQAYLSKFSNVSTCTEYSSYNGAKQRCTNRNSIQYKYYGERGIKFLFISFAEFLYAVGNRPAKGYSLDRIDSRGHYELGNVRWATASEQSRNTSGARWLEFNGDKMLLTDMAAKYGMKQATLAGRLRLGWSVNDALTRPVGKARRKEQPPAASIADDFEFLEDLDKVKQYLSSVPNRCYLPEYNSYCAAKYRCTNANTVGYDSYGGAGVLFLFDSFEEFLYWIGRRPSKEYSVDRIYSELGYSPGNVRWATRKEQSENLSTNRWLEFRGDRLTISAMARKYGVPKSTLGARLSREWSVEKALTTPPGSRTEKRKRRETRWLEFRGERLTLTDMAKKYGILVGTLRNRLRRGWSLEKALTTPIDSRLRKRNRMIELLKSKVKVVS